MKELTQERLKEVLYYDKETGVFTWVVYKGANAKIGDIAGSLDKSNGYIYICIEQNNYRANRLAWFYIEGYWPEHEIDHKDRVRSNNKWSNLRHITRLCNSRNCSIGKNNTSGVSGVSYYKRTHKWTSRIRVNYKLINLGYYKEFNAAVRARWDAEVLYEFPNCNTESTAYNYLKDNNLI